MQHFFTLFTFLVYPNYYHNKPNLILSIIINNIFKEFEELLLDNTLLKVHNQALGDKNPKWKKWWQIVQEFMEKYIQENMELTRSNEQVYQLELCEVIFCPSTLNFMK
jgi:hypothetical protein